MKIDATPGKWHSRWSCGRWRCNRLSSICWCGGSASFSGIQLQQLADCVLHLATCEGVGVSQCE